MKKILCVSGSTRTGSTCLTILQTIAERYAGQADFIFYTQLAALPHFDPDAEDTALPPLVREFRNAVSGADAVIFCTPEYVFSVPAILKNALEWCVASTVFSDKPTAMIVASGAGEKTFESLGLILRTIQTKISAETMLHLKGARAKFTSDGEMVARVDVMFRALLV